MSYLEIFSFIMVFIAGFIDSIAGGGGLITVPVFTLLVGPGAIAIGTNKVAGFFAAATALIVYMRKGHLQLRRSGGFLVSLCIGTLAGAKLAMIIPVNYFEWFLLAICPVILFITLKRDSFITREHNSFEEGASPYLIAFLGFLCGLYDGAFGPGGGTFMFLSLAGWGGFPLVAAIATSKLANSLSAGVSLVSFALDRSVVWKVGAPMAAAALVGALIGSNFASTRAKKVVRPVLVIVVVLLLVKVARGLINAG